MSVFYMIHSILCIQKIIPKRGPMLQERLGRICSPVWAMSTQFSGTKESPPDPILYISYHGVSSACLSMCQSQELSECPTFGGHSKEGLSMALGSGPACAPELLALGLSSGQLWLCPVRREMAASTSFGSSWAVFSVAAVDHFPF